MRLQRVQPAPLPQLGSGNGVPGAPPPLTSPLTAGNEDKQIFHLNLLRALQLHRRLAIGIAVAGFALAAAYVVKMWPIYTAQSQIYVQPVQSKVMPQANDQGWPNNPATYDSYIQQQVQSASNPDVLLSALHKLGPGAWQRSDETEQAAAERLGRSIEVARVGTSYEVAITARAKKPDLSAQIANAVASSIVERASGEGNAGDLQRIAVLREERDRIQNELNSDYAEQDALNKQLGMAAVGTAAPDLIDDDIGRTREELIKAETDHDEAAARFAAMDAGQGSSSAAIDAQADELVAADPGLTSMKTSLNQRRALMITQMSNLTPNNPEYKQDAAELAKINSTLDSMMKDLRGKASTSIQERLRTDLERTAGVEARLNGQLRQLAGTAASATPKLQRASDLATDIVRLRARFTSVDEQLHNLMLEDSVPGAVHLSVAAVAPLHPTVSGILRKALPLALGGIIFGLLAASLANHLDSRVYIAADVEQVLGFAPMAVLPDFTEVSNEVAAEHMLRLSAAIEHARKQGDLKSCIFTGASSGAGVTTVVTRVRDILEAMGRPTVLMDASGTPHPAPRASGLNNTSGQPAAQLGSRSTALLKQVAEETRMQQENLVLTDTAPLVISAETDYLARFVDCAIVVIESGVTRRAQLLAAVNTLQRLEVPAVGFVLNRVGLAKADPSFRYSVQEVEKHLRAQSASTSRRTVRSRHMVDEPLPEPEQIPSETSSANRSSSPVSKPTYEAAARRSSRAVPQWPMAVPAPPEAPPPEPAPTKDAELPWWLSDAHPQPAAALWKPARLPESVSPPPPAQEFQPELPPVRRWEDVSSEPVEVTPQSAWEEDHFAPGHEDSSYEPTSRLSSLRSVLFSLGLKNLNKAKEPSVEDEVAVSPVESEPEPAVFASTVVPFHEPIPAPVAPPAVSEVIPPVRQTARPELLSPREFVPLNDREQVREAISTIRKDRRDAYDEVQILPSKRGQYKKKG